MTDESLSALLDGECSPAELDRVLDEMERNPALRERFSRLTLARESGHGTRVRAADLGFSARVLAALDGPATTTSVVPFPGRWNARAALPWRPLTGFAAAAAVATIAVIAVRPDATIQAPPPAVTSSAVAEPTGILNPAADPTYRRWAQLNASDARELNTYFMTYSSTRAQQGMGGALGYARYALDPPAERSAEASPSQTDPPRE